MSACVLKSSTVWADVEPEEPDDGAESVATSSGSEADSDGVEEGEEEEEAEDLSQLHSPLSSPVRSPIAGARREARGRRATSVQSCSSAGSADAVGAAVAPAGRLSDREHLEHAAPAAMAGCMSSGCLLPSAFWCMSSGCLSARCSRDRRCCAKTWADGSK
jgi:hypothetical protein